MAPKIHAKVLASLDAKEIAGPVPLQMVAVEALVTVGRGLTVTVMSLLFVLQATPFRVLIVIRL